MLCGVEETAETSAGLVPAMAGSCMECWVQLLAGTSKVAEWPKGLNPVLRDPQGLDESQ